VNSKDHSVSDPLAGLARLDQVQVKTPRRVVTITWAERELLLARLQPDTESRRATTRHRKPPEVPEMHHAMVAAFMAVGVSRPVVLRAKERQVLLAVLDGWEGELPDGLRELHAALADE
jgi:hypothetical protein